MSNKIKDQNDSFKKRNRELKVKLIKNRVNSMS